MTGTQHTGAKRNLHRFSTLQVQVLNPNDPDKHAFCRLSPFSICMERTSNISRLMIWARITGQKIAPPFFFSRNVTASSYKELLRTCVPPQLETDGVRSTIWSHHDGAPAHYVQSV
ncbi:unnamed protein product [Dicrocoelium dendriticum]|nr:unnamed protein product [Dicrocoelium dendriticum]